LSGDRGLIQSQRKLDGLHGLRAAAALAVVLFHLQRIPGLPLPGWISSVTSDAYLSVHLFFVLSAFSLFHSSRYAPAGYAAYLAKRFFRIAPLYYVMLAFMLWRDGFPGWKVLASNLTFAFNLINGYEQSMVWAGWSVGVEMLFYLMLPGLLLLGRRSAGLIILFLASCLVSAAVWHLTTGAPGRREYFAYFSLAGAMPSFSAGLLAYRVFMFADARPRRERGGVILASMFGVLLALAFFDPLGLHARASGLYFAFWGLPFGVLCLWQARYPSRLMCTSPAQWLADRSFSIYLLHPVVIEYLRPAYEYARLRGIPDGAWLYLACLATTLPVLLVAAQITYRLVELPGIEVGRRVAAFINTSPKAGVRALAPFEPER
jgi:peptidoglycan/LPS O-acetylase OafA/YrhL